MGQDVSGACGQLALTSKKAALAGKTEGLPAQFDIEDMVRKKGNRRGAGQKGVVRRTNKAVARSDSNDDVNTKNAMSAASSPPLGDHKPSTLSAFLLALAVLVPAALIAYTILATR